MYPVWTHSLLDKFFSHFESMLQARSRLCVSGRDNVHATFARMGRLRSQKSDAWPLRVNTSGKIIVAYIMYMKQEQVLESITKLSDNELLRRLSELLSQSRRVESELVAHIGEVDARRLYAEKSSSSMYVYCVDVLHLSEAEAYLRINVARAARKHPMLLEMLAARKTKRQIDELVAELSPKPDVAATMRKIPTRRKKTKPTSETELCPDRVALPTSVPHQDEPTASPDNTPARVEPIAPARYKVQFTASAELHDKLERLRALMRPSVPDSDLATIIEAAVTEKLERPESKRYGKTKAPRKSLGETDTAPSSRYIPAPVRRAVYERDQGQCNVARMIM
jgi:hypothetical protein